MKNEAHWNTILNQYLREKRLYCYYELKDTSGNQTFNFAQIEKVQYEGLQATEKEGLVWKLSDQDQRPKPCDGFCTPPLPSYLVLKIGRGFYFIRFERIVEMRDEGRISIKLTEAKKIAEKIIELT